MAKFESLFNIGDWIFRKEDIIAWANGRNAAMSSYEIVRIDISSTNKETGVAYHTAKGAVIREESAVAEDAARSIAIQHLSARISEVASVVFPSDKK